MPTKINIEAAHKQKSILKIYSEKLSVMSEMI